MEKILNDTVKEKLYKVTYKVHFYERLQKIYFHGKLTFPIYILITFDRKSIIFKSYYFELFSKPKYAILNSGQIKGPAIKDIIKMENEILEFIILKNIGNFSLELFKKEYAFYSKDLCDMMEIGFGDFLHTYLNDKSMPVLAKTIKEGSKDQILYDIVVEFKLALQPELYNELVEHSFYYGPPYLALYGFMKQLKKWPLLSLTVREWGESSIKKRYILYTEKNYPKLDQRLLTEEVKKLIEALQIVANG